MVCATSKASDQPAHTPIKLLTEKHLEFLSLKGGCTGSSESTPVKITHCWKSHAAADYIFTASPEPAEWGEWGDCSTTCGAGWRSRYRQCDNCDINHFQNVQSQPCVLNYYCPRKYRQLKLISDINHVHNGCTVTALCDELLLSIYVHNVQSQPCVINYYCPRKYRQLKLISDIYHVHNDCTVTSLCDKLLLST